MVRAAASGHRPPDELALPGEDGVGLHDDRELNEQPATEQDALGCEASALVIGEAQALTTELGFQEAILLEAVFA